ncbi:MAG TPA: protein-glutamate O-methyltransferase CheR, partial [Telluria sp.]|nr:protein-glutamate O-methyltransferase CheR [Telluria sp.]
MRELGLSRRADYVARLCGREVDELAELVVVPESWMFRDPVAFACATTHVRERLARQPGHAPRILSAPCAGGEEPYSMAMALADAGVAPGACRIDAIDLSAVSIARARSGHYTRNAFRGGRMEFRDRYFTPDGDNYQLCDDIRAAVRFEQANLFALDGVCAAGYDVIFCRNLLIYFDDDGIRRAAAVLSQLLAEDGILLAGPAEVPALCAHGFTPVGVSGAFALRKGGAAPAPARPRPRAVAPRRVMPLPPAPLPAAPIQVRAQPPAVAAPAPVHHLGDAQRMADAGRLREAADACQALLAVTPDEPRAWFILGLVSQCLGDGAAAERHWRRCLYLQPNHYEALCALALLAEQRGEPSLATLYRQRAARAGTGGSHAA